jgi:hypothetical protein
MKVLDRNSVKDIQLSLLQEIAKTTNEIKCAQKDLTKALSRAQFSIVLLNELINRKEED